MSTQSTKELNRSEKRGALVVLLMLGGLGIAAFFWLAFSPAVDSTINFGMEFDRLIGFLAGLAVFFAGLLILLFGKVANAVAKSNDKNS